MYKRLNDTKKYKIRNKRDIFNPLIKPIYLFEKSQDFNPHIDVDYMLGKEDPKRTLKVVSNKYLRDKIN